ncbi:hypothetical protein [Planctobacterium marinum]|uniref:Uncharacterized protein n=1 Tax=Planctobacterium marinum TaxID=1631968 RepID=A0AA48KPZ4_9ALTE|nr:hypothetical protein MACH26_27220 [Planctobacterium marinum]
MLNLSPQETLFITQLEDCTLPAEQFDHVGHLKLAFLQLQRFEQEVAMQRILDGIKRYATSLGAAQKYHKTLSWFMVKEIAWRMTEQACINWSDFLAANSDLLENSQKLVHRHYSESLLATDWARVNIAEPDKSKPEWYV